MKTRNFSFSDDGMLALLFAVVLTLGLFMWLTREAGAQPVTTVCPNDEPCRVVVLTKTEEEILLGERGILATASQARNLDLGQYVAYFRQKIMGSPAGTKAPAPETPAPKK